MRKSVKRGLIGAVAFLVVAIGIAAIGWRVAGLAFVETLITASLQEQGVPVSALTLRSMGPGAAVLTDVRLELAGVLTIGRIEARYRLVDLVRDRRIERVVVSGVRADLSSTAVEGSNEPELAISALPILPVDSIVMEDSAFSIATPIGALEVAIDLEGRPQADGGIDLSGQVVIGGESGMAAVPFTAAVSRSGGYDLTLVPESARIGWQGTNLDLREGSVTLAGTLAGLQTVDGTLAAELATPDGSAVSLTAVGGLADNSGRLEIALDSGVTEGRASLTASLVGLDRNAPTFDLAMEADLQLLGRLPGLAGVATDWYSAGTVNARYSGVVDRGAAGAGPQLGGPLAIATDLASLETGRRLMTDLAAELQISPGAMRLKSTAPSTLSWWPETGEDAITLTLGDDTGGDFDVSMGQVGDGWTLKASGPYGLADRDGLVSGVIGVTGSADTAGNGLAGRFAAEIDASGPILGAVMVDGGRAELAASFELDDGGWRILPDPCMPIMAERLSDVAGLAIVDGLSACLAASPDQPLLEIGAEASDVVAINLAARPDATTILLDTGAAERLRLDLKLPEVTIVARLAGDGGALVDVATSDAALTLPGLGLAVDDIALALSAGEGADQPFRLRLDARSLRSLAEPAWFAPVRIIGEANSRDADIVALDVDIRGAGGAIAATVEGQHKLSSGTGRIDIRLDPVSFAPGGRQPADLSPALGPSSIGEIAGTLTASGRIGWGQRLTSTAELSLEDLTLTTSGATVRGVNGTIRADGLFPLSLPDGQVLTVAGADLGFPLDEGAVAFGLAEGNRLSIQGVGFGFAGGVLALQPFHTVIGDRSVELVAMMQGVDLARLSQIFPVEGLMLSGSLDGRIPIRLIEDTISIEGGVLESTEPGVIRYVTTVPLGPEGEGGVALLLNAVQNFQYEGLRVTVDGKTGDDLEVAIRLTGANPELYDGFPIALNINLAGELEQILRSGLRSIGIADEAGSLLRGQ